MNSKKIYFILIICMIAISLYSLTNGNMDISIRDIMNILIGNTKNIDSSFVTIIYDIRLPRIFMAILVGMLLASSGTVVQTVFQNPLADPYIIGISASATFGAVIAYLMKLPDFMYGILAFAISVVTSQVIFRMSKTGKKTNISTLLIIGIAISSFLGSFTSFAMYLIGENSFKITSWLMGYLGSATWNKIYILFVPLLLSSGYFFLKRHELDLLLSGDEEAHALGIDVEKLKKNMLIVASLIVGFSVAFSGTIGFVGLIVPHTIRLLIKSSSNTKLIPLSILSGGVFLLSCDTFGRILLSPIEIPIGVITSFIGAPFFLYLAMRGKKG